MRQGTGPGDGIAIGSLISSGRRGDRPHRRTDGRRLPAVVTGLVWVGTGAAWLATWEAYRLGPSYSAPQTALDYVSIGLFSGGLLMTGASLWAVALATCVGGTTRVIGGFAAFGAALAGVADVFEDGVGVSWFAYPFFAGILILGAASVGFAIALAKTRPGFRLAAVAALLAVTPFALGDTGPGKLIGGGLWLALGLQGLRRQRSVSGSARDTP
jgi:hypothetical protein